MIVPWLTVGGSDKFNLDLLQELTRQGWDVTIATTLKGDHSWLPLFARHTPDIFILHHFLRLVDYPRFLRYLIQSRQVDVVLITHSELGYLLLPYLASHFPDVSFVDFCHLQEESWKNGGYPRMAIEYQELLDLDVVASDHLKGWMTQRGADPDRIRICYTNIDPDEWRPDPERRATVRREFGLSDAVTIILFVGRICAQKQPRVLAETLLQLHKQVSDFVALVAGEGPELEFLRSFVKRHGLGDKVRLLGAVPNERIKQLMAAADVFFLPSQWEGIALTLYEAMACALPVVGADVGGQRELVTPECGILIPRDGEKPETQRYVEILTELLKSPDRRREMGQAARARVHTHYRLELMGVKMMAFFEEAADGRARYPRPKPSPGLGRACAAQAVEMFRLFEVANEMWAARQKAGLRVQLYLALSGLARPAFRWGVNRGLTWFIPLAERIKRVLLRPA